MKRLLICLALGLAGATIVPAQRIGTIGSVGTTPNGGGIHLPPPTSGTWARLSNSPPFETAASAWLLTDGTVLVMSLDGDGSCYKLTPDVTGNYGNGTWSQVASMHTPRLYFASAVLADGRLIVAGGEYVDSGSGYNDSGSNACEIYDPVANTWTALSAPSGWTQIGAAPSMVLPGGQFMLGSEYPNGSSSAQSALFDPLTNTWSTTVGLGLAATFERDAWTLLPTGNVLDIECQNSPNTDYYDPTTNTWSNVGVVPGPLVDSTTATGANVLLPNGTVLAIGANANTDIYNVSTNTWSAGPSNPVLNSIQLCQAGGPAAVLPDGNVLLAESPYSPGNDDSTPTEMYEFDGTEFTAVTNPPIAPYISANQAEFLVLPTGQVLMTSESNAIYLYTPAGTYQTAWQPTITSVAGTVSQGGLGYALSGTQLNGVSQGAAFGDENASFTNYPIVRIQNSATGNVYYCRTHNHSTMGVQTGSSIVSTEFDVPTAVPSGPANLYVVTNGIPSAPQAINVVTSNVVLPNAYTIFRGVLTGGSLSSLFYADSNPLKVEAGSVLLSTEAPVQVIVTGTSPTTTPVSLTFTVTAKTNSGDISQSIALYNYSTGTYDTLSTQASTTSYATVTVTASGTLSNYVNASGAVQARVSYIATGSTLIYPWTASLDLTNWTIQ